MIDQDWWIQFWGGFNIPGQMEGLHWILAAFQFLSLLALAKSILIAHQSIDSNKEVVRRRTTIELIEKAESTPRYRELNRVFREVFNRGTQFAEQLERVHDPQTDEDLTKRRHIQGFLNSYELISLGIKEKTLEASTYREWMGTAFISDWNLASVYIQRERWKYDKLRDKWIYSHRLYENFEELARVWGQELGRQVVHISDRTTLPPTVPKGPGDVALAQSVRTGQPLRKLERVV